VMMKKLNILQVFNFLSLPHGGGTADIIQGLSKALVRNGHKVTLCIGDYELDRDYLLDLVDASVNIKMYRSYFNTHGLYVMPGLATLDIRQYDVIHLHCYRGIQNAMICYKAQKYGIPYVIDSHGSTVDTGGRKEVLKNLYDRLVGYRNLKYTGGVIAETEVGVSEYLDLGVELNKIYLIHPLLEISEYSHLPEYGNFRDRHGIRKEFIVLFMGRLHHAKGIEVLVDAVKLLIQNGEDIKLVLAGQDDGHAGKLMAMVKDKGMTGRVLFTGFLGAQDKRTALVDADVLVQPSKNEAGARPSLEAILCGTPVIVAKDTGAGKQIDKIDGGYTVLRVNKTQIAVAIHRILVDKNGADKRTLAAKAYIEKNLSYEKQLCQYEQLYCEVIR